MKTPTQVDYQNYTGLHCHKIWKEVGPHYHCPSCLRTKFELLKWTTRFPGKDTAFKDWVATLHRHHDHSDTSLEKMLGRFPVTIICGQCNSADGAVKRKLKLPKNFSFAPEEISHFIVVKPHAPHVINFIRAAQIYEHITSYNSY